MPRKIEKPLEVVTIKLFSGDRETLAAFYPAPLGYNAAVRAIVHHHCNKLRERASREGATHAGVDFSEPSPELDALIASAVDASPAGAGEG